tara:strand:- start:214 stop:645 length:432 start_codon:yes stop_codon:yes gene_type:complete
MIILKTLATAQALSVIPRDYLSTFTMGVRDDSTNVTVNYGINNAVTSGDYLNFNNIFNPILVENHFYDLYLYVDYNYWNSNNSFWNLYDVLWQTDSDYKEDVYRDKIFCTNQDIDQLNDNDHYQLNKGQFTTYNGFDNTYIVI